MQIATTKEISAQHTTLTNFLADDQLTKAQITDLIALAINIKNHPADYNQALAGKSVAMIFEKPSLRTHVSFDMGINKLGGHALYLGQQNGKLGERDEYWDAARRRDRLLVRGVIFSNVPQRACGLVHPGCAQRLVAGPQHFLRSLVTHARVRYRLLVLVVQVR